VRKAFLGPLAQRRPWPQVVPTYSRHKDVLRVNKVVSSCPVSSQLRQDVTYTTM